MSAEDDLIARLFAPIAGPGGLGLRDDAGLVNVPAGTELVVTADAVVAGVHFFPDDPPASIAVKALGVNLSDLAAKAAAPHGFLLSLALPATCDSGWLDAFAEALGETARNAGCALLGGDTVATPGPLTIAITALGLVETGAMLRRTAARTGDVIYVSGTIGDGALGLAVRTAERGGGPEASAWIETLGPADRAHLRERYLRPQPRLALRRALRSANAGMDVSDGLVGDLTKMLRVSGVSGRVEVARVPLSAAASAAAAAQPQLRVAILTGGDDYEIVATVAPALRVTFEQEAETAGVSVTAIGFVLEGTAAPLFVDEAGSPVAFERSSFSHL